MAIASDANLSQSVENPDLPSPPKKENYDRLRQTPISENVVNLEHLLTQFLQKWNKYFFNAIRILNFGKQTGFQDFKNYSVDEINIALQNMHHKGLLKTKISKKGNVLYGLRK
jgi:hypothetical protein